MDPTRETTIVYSVWNLDDDQLGFVLLSGSPEGGECLIKLQPADEANLHNEESVFLLKLQTIDALFWARVNDGYRIYDANDETWLEEKEGFMKGSGFLYRVEVMS